jgi:anoctamin-10
MTTALLLALTASHGYILFRAVVRHILERALWKGSEEEKIVEGASGRGSEDVVDKVTVTVDGASKDQGGFWVDNGVDEIRRTGKTE